MIAKQGRSHLIFLCCAAALCVASAAHAQAGNTQGKQQPVHMECQGMDCVPRPGAGANQCSTHGECRRKKCVALACTSVPKDGQPDSCAHDNGCDTECSRNGQGTGSIYTEGQCGACTSGACAGKSVGNSCTVSDKVLGDDGLLLTFVSQGKCKASDNCSSADPGGNNYENACGMACACDLNPATTEVIIEDFIEGDVQ